ncbi:DUF302 domain-containing protein [Actinoplanes solisilvae]|uniref:DUF302 domain-containing protein n=1 Tax=Actinoplanes solisilvae TaxID=2486853 RepID=UPI0013E401F6|nr:DUF302 domain-containing protein [Actinoplanes solisilvae]
MTETRRRVTVERVTLETTKKFDDVLAGIYEGISRPDLKAAVKTWNEAETYEEFQAAVAKTSGPAGLTQFLRLDQDAALGKLPDTPQRRQVRLIVGNAFTMTQMTRYVPDAGSYAPTTILIWEDGDTVRVAYDLEASLVAPYGDERVSKVARELDEEVLTLLRNAVS